MKNQLRRLTVRHFKSIAGEVIIDFPATGTMLIEGRNKNTGGSSGAGKSVVFTALNIALGCSTHPMTKAQSWLSEESVAVMLEWENSIEGSCTLVRGRNNSLRMGSKEPITSAGTIKTELKRLFGVEPDLMKVLTYTPQQDFKDFLAKPNADKQTFLATILGLHDFEKAVESAQDKLKSLVVDEETAKGRLEIHRSSVASAEALSKAAEFTPQETQGLENLLYAAKKDVEIWRADWGTLNAEYMKAKYQGRRDELVKKARSAFLQDAATADYDLHTIKTEHEAVIKAVPPVSEAETQITARISIGEKKVLEVRAGDAKKNTDFLTQSRELDTKIATIKASERQLALLKPQLDKAKKSLLSLESRTCPTCSQQWIKAQEQLAATRNEITVLEEQIGGISSAQAKLPELTAARALLKFEPDPLLGKIQDGIRLLEDQRRTLAMKRSEGHRDLMAASSKKVSEAEEVVWEIEQKAKAAEAQVDKEISAEVQLCQQKASDANELLHGAERNLKEAEHKLDMANRDNQLRTNQRLLADKNLKDAYDAKEKSMNALALAMVNANAEREFIRVTGREGFLGRIFDEVLQEISGEANRILGRVANTAHVTIDFQSENITSKGKVEKEINVKVSVSGHDADFDFGISGGMTSAVRLAVKLAIRRVVFRRAGIHLGWNCLDESFDGLDPVSKEACFEILAEDAQDSLILVVDHSPEFKSMFQNSIVMEYLDGVTTLGESK